MRKIIVILLFILLIPSVNADIVDDIRLLNPEEQVHTMVEIFRYKESYMRIGPFARCVHLLSENPMRRAIKFGEKSVARQNSSRYSRLR
jgi:hypothetical protein